MCYYVYSLRPSNGNQLTDIDLEPLETEYIYIGDPTLPNIDLIIIAVNGPLETAAVEETGSGL